MLFTNFIIIRQFYKYLLNLYRIRIIIHLLSLNINPLEKLSSVYVILINIWLQVEKQLTVLNSYLKYLSPVTTKNFSINKSESKTAI